MVILLNIFLGIIVSTFAQLRDEKKMIKEDMENNCFICNIDRQTFDKDGNGFAAHIKQDHYLWHYINFVVHLREKDPTEYTGVESYIADMLKGHNIGWFPLHKALVLGDSEPSEKQALEVFLDKVASLESRIGDFEKAAKSSKRK